MRLADSDSTSYPQEPIVLLDGFEEALVGVCKDRRLFQRAVYNYWKCIDILIKVDDFEFDEALDWMEGVEDEDLGENSPIFMKDL